MKNVLRCIVYTSQTTYINKRIISEGGRLIDKFLEICDMYNEEGFLVTISIEKVFNTVNHDFLIMVLEKFGFGNMFIQWIKVLKDQEFYCPTSQYFKLERGIRQGDLIWPYLFILLLQHQTKQRYQKYLIT